jgi:hypothetical protein
MIILTNAAGGRAQKIAKCATVLAIFSEAEQAEA